jgi:hypothetical protein
VSTRSAAKNSPLQYIDLNRLRPDVPRDGDLFGEVTEFARASRAREFYESFNVDSKNFTEKSNGTRSWIATCRRLLARLVARSTKIDPGRIRTALETIFGLLRRIDEGCDDVIFFADEGGSWQVGVDWKTVFDAYFACFSKTAEPDEYARRVVAIIDEFAATGRWSSRSICRFSTSSRSKEAA